MVSRTRVELNLFRAVRLIPTTLSAASKITSKISQNKVLQVLEQSRDTGRSTVDSTETGLIMVHSCSERTSRHPRNHLKKMNVMMHFESNSSSKSIEMKEDQIAVTMSLKSTVPGVARAIKVTVCAISN